MPLQKSPSQSEKPAVQEKVVSQPTQEQLSELACLLSKNESDVKHNLAWDEIKFPSGSASQIANQMYGDLQQFEYFSYRTVTLRKQREEDNMFSLPQLEVLVLRPTLSIPAVLLFN